MSFNMFLFYDAASLTVPLITFQALVRCISSTNNHRLFHFIYT